MDKNLLIKLLTENQIDHIKLCITISGPQDDPYIENIVIADLNEVLYHPDTKTLDLWQNNGYEI